MNKIGNEGASSLAEALKINSSLTRIDLSYNDNDSHFIRYDLLFVIVFIITGNEFGIEGSKTIAEALKANKALTRVDIPGNTDDNK